MTYLKANLVLKSGKVLKVRVTADRKFDAESFTDKTLQSFMPPDETSLIFIQGDRIDYIEVFQ